MSNYEENITNSWKDDINELLSDFNYHQVLCKKSKELTKHLCCFSGITDYNEQRRKFEDEFECQLEFIIKKMTHEGVEDKTIQHYSNWMERITKKYFLFVSCCPQKTEGNSPDNIDDLLQQLDLDISSIKKDNVYAAIIESHFGKVHRLEINFSKNDGSSSKRLVEDAHLLIQLIENTSIDNEEILKRKYFEYKFFSTKDSSIYSNQYLCYHFGEINITTDDRVGKEWLEKIQQPRIILTSEMDPKVFKKNFIDPIEKKIEDEIYYAPVEEYRIKTNGEKIVHIRKLIAEDKMGDAISFLENNNEDKDLEDDITMLESSHTKNEKERGRTPTDIYNTENKKVKKSILELSRIAFKST